MERAKILFKKQCPSFWVKREGFFTIKLNLFFPPFNSRDHEPQYVSIGNVIQESADQISLA